MKFRKVLAILHPVVSHGVEPTCAAVEPDVADSAMVEAFVDGVVKPNMKQFHRPSGVVAVMKDGKMMCLRACATV